MTWLFVHILILFLLLFLDPFLPATNLIPFGLNPFLLSFSICFGRRLSPCIVSVLLNSPVLVSLCRNCHYRISKVQNEQWPEDWYKKKHSQSRKNAYLLRGMSDLLRLISDVALDKTNRWEKRPLRLGHTRFQKSQKTMKILGAKTTMKCPQNLKGFVLLAYASYY